MVVRNTGTRFVLSPIFKIKNLKKISMQVQNLSENAIESIIGKKIIDAKSNWIKLDDGCIIYLDDEEIEMLNQ
jgi:hypothetical protein